MNSELIQEKLRYVNGDSYSRVLSELWEREVTFISNSQDAFRMMYEHNHIIDRFIDLHFEKGEKIFVTYNSNKFFFNSESGVFIFEPSEFLSSIHAQYKKADESYTSIYSFDYKGDKFYVKSFEIVDSNLTFELWRHGLEDVTGHFGVTPVDADRPIFFLRFSGVESFFSVENLEYLVQVYKHHPIKSFDDFNAAIFRYSKVIDLSEKFEISSEAFSCEYNCSHLMRLDCTLGKKSYKYYYSGGYSVTWPNDVKLEVKDNRITYSGPEKDILETISAMKSDIQEIISKYQYLSVKTLDKEEISRMDECELTNALSKLLGMRFEFESYMDQDKFVSAYRHFKRQDILNYVFINMLRDTDSAIRIRQIENREFFEITSDKDTLILELRWNDNYIEKNYVEYKRAEDDFSRFYQLDYTEYMHCIGYGITEDNFVFSVKKSQISEGETVFSVYSREDYQDIIYISSISHRTFKISDIEALKKTYDEFSNLSLDTLQSLIIELKKFFDIDNKLFIGAHGFRSCGFDARSIQSFDITLGDKRFYYMRGYFTISFGYLEIRGFLGKDEIVKSGFANTNEVIVSAIIDNMKKEFDEVYSKFNSIEI